MTAEVTQYKLTHRQSKLIPADKLLEYTPVVIGLGNVGRQVALCLARMGAQNIILVDHDTVEAENCYPQGYPITDIGKSKVEACLEDLDDFSAPPAHAAATMKVVTAIAKGYQAKFNAQEHLPKDPTTAVIFCCVDSIVTRKQIFQSTVIDKGCPFFVDGRVGGEALLVLTATPETARDYVETLFDPAERVDAPCGARATIYTGMLAAGFMCSKFAFWLRGVEVASRMALTLYDDDISYPEFDNGSTASQARSD